MLKIKEIRNKRGLSIRTLAEMAGIHWRTLAELENRGYCRIDIADKIAKALDLTLNDIWQREED